MDPWAFAQCSQEEYQYHVRQMGLQEEENKKLELAQEYVDQLSDEFDQCKALIMSVRYNSRIPENPDGDFGSCRPNQHILGNFITKL